MAYKIVIADPEDGKNIQVEVEGAQAKRLEGKKIGETIKGDIVGLTGYQLEITGGSSTAGFPMKKGVKGNGIKSIILSKGIGYQTKEKGARKKKTVHTEKIDKDIVQINTKITEKGKKSVEELIGTQEEDEKEEKEEKEK